MLKLLASMVTLLALVSSATAEDFTRFDVFPVPMDAEDAREPSLYAMQDGRLLMSWVEGSGASTAVKVAILANGTWGTPNTVTAARDIFVNWADFASVSAFKDGTLIAHWLQTSAHSTYDYDVRITLSQDDGETWSAPFAPHGDGTQTQHGFVTLMPLDNEVVAVWLDGRAYGKNLADDRAIPDHMQLRAAFISSDGTATADTALDFATCSCCQTAAANSNETLLVAYRDRSKAEIRDISIVRLSDGHWSEPASVHEDGWELSGCPVNGPAIAAHDRSVVVAWFTAANDIPAVNIAFSEDSGVSFGDAVRIDRGAPLGRVDTLMLEDGSALVSWVEWDGPNEIILICRVTTDGCTGSQRLAVNIEGSSVNFPQMAATTEDIYIAWTQPLPDGTDTIRMVRSAWQH